MNKEVTDPVDDAGKHDIKKAVVEICWDAQKTIQLSGNAKDFVQLGPNLVPHLLCRVAIFFVAEQLYTQPCVCVCMSPDLHVPLPRLG